VERLQRTQVSGPPSREQSVMSSPSRTQGSSRWIAASCAHWAAAGNTSLCVSHSPKTAGSPWDDDINHI
jgi:hypothetical protein